METGSPLPADLETIHAAAVLNAHSASDRDALIKRLHAAHHDYNAEHEALYEKQRTIKATLDMLYRNRDLAQRASFDTVLAIGRKGFTVEKAKQYLEDAKDGLVNLGSGMADRLKRIIESGKDEE